MPTATLGDNSSKIQVGNVTITIDPAKKRLVLDWSYEVRRKHSLVASIETILTDLARLQEEDLAAHVLTAIDRALHASDSTFAGDVTMTDVK